MARSRIELILENKRMLVAIKAAHKALTTEEIDAPQNKAIRILDDVMEECSHDK